MAHFTLIPVLVHKNLSYTFISNNKTLGVF